MKHTLTILALLFTASLSSAQNVQTFSFQGNVFQQFIVPASGWYFIDASGAQGGPASNGSHQGGLGARMQGNLQLQAGDTLRIAVGGQGGTGVNGGNNVSGGGGGGATSMVKVNGSTYFQLLFAGGGGGGAANYDGSPGLTTNNGGFSWGGTNGSGGGIGVNSSSYGGAGGGGYNGNGGDHYQSSTLVTAGGLAYLNGNGGGYSPYGSCKGGVGGWGGGGQGGLGNTGPFYNHNGGGGGGGGWSGGGGGKNEGDGGGGGGSYLDASFNTYNCFALDGANYGDGILRITYLTYSTNSGSVDSTFSFQGNLFQYFTVPVTGYYQITARGAQGGSVNCNQGGKGAQMQGYFLLLEGETVRIAVGGSGQAGSWFTTGLTDQPTAYSGAGGGGASFVDRPGVELLIVAGGGGGGAYANDGIDATISTSGLSGGGDITLLPGTGGTNGGGGDNSGNQYGGAGGAGYYTDGGTNYCIYACNGSNALTFGGQAFLNGNFGGGGFLGSNGGWGGGGEGGSVQIYQLPANLTTCPPPLGAAAPAGDPCSRELGGGGGGGGYSGGGGGFSNCPSEAGPGGGGGSFSAAQCAGANISGANTGNGSVSISGPNVSIDTVNTPGPTYTWAVNGVTYQHSGTYYHVDQANCIVRVLDLSIGGLGGCLNYTRIDTTIISCGGYTNPLNGATYTENTTDSFRIGCTKYVAQVITSSPLMLPAGNYVNASGVIWTSTLLGGINAGLLASPSSPLSVCKNSTETYSIPAFPYATSYQWTLPAGATGASTTNSITVRFSNSFSGGNICVTPVNACGAGATLCRAITVLNTPPTGRLQITGPSAPFISGNYSVAPVPGATSYTWSVSNNQAVIVSGQGTPDIQLEAQFGFTRANLSVVASNCKGNGSRGTLALKAYGNGTGAAAPARMSAVETEELSVYPNPSNGQFTLNTPSLETDATVEVYSTEGRLVHAQIIPSHTTQTLIFLQQPAAGLYQVRLVAGDEVRNVKIVVQ